LWWIKPDRTKLPVFTHLPILILLKPQAKTSIEREGQGAYESIQKRLNTYAW